MAKPLTISLGEILWDVLPDGKILGGSPANVAWHVNQLGADAHIVSAIGQDDLGDEILRRLAEMNLDTSAIVRIPDVPTSTVDAMLDDRGNATYVIHENVAWDAMPVTDDVLRLASQATAVNYGSLAQRHPFGRASTLAILDAIDPSAIKIFDINLRPPFIDRDVIDAGLLRANVLKMNNDELPLLADLFGWATAPEAAMAQLFVAYPNITQLVVTCGADGAQWCTPERLHVQKPPAVGRVVDTIGAGDSVTATVMMGLLKGWEVEKTLEAAMAVASFVCSQRGGTPELPAELRKLFG
ncbi:MAG: carbohydrate kinase [Planctomycetes bacterium]|nr:carbohydrate kinase [Planctomycetota bacterium]